MDIVNGTLREEEILVDVLLNFFLFSLSLMILAAANAMIMSSGQVRQRQD